MEGNNENIYNSFSDGAQLSFGTNISLVPLENLDAGQKQEYLLKLLQENVQGADLFICLFMSALYSNRADQCLRPFPNFHVNNGNKDFGKLRRICDNMLSIRDTLKVKKFNSEVTDLLLWLFLDTGQPTLKQIKYEDVSLQVTKTLVPDYVFAVTYAKKVNDAWEKRKENKNTFLVYHGSRVENFYSILKVGLQQHFSTQRVVLYGDGIYLTSEITVSTNYAPFGQTWKNSMFGNKHSIIAVCEVIDDVDKVKCKDGKYKKRAIVKGAFGEIPEKYFVVTDSDLVRIKYLFVYKSSTTSYLKSYFSNIPLVFVIGYFLMLILIGFFNSSFWKKVLHQFVYT